MLQINDIVLANHMNRFNFQIYQKGEDCIEGYMAKSRKFVSNIAVNNIFIVYYIARRFVGG